MWNTLFGYPGACTIDISDELYKQDYTTSDSSKTGGRHWFMRQMLMQGSTGKVGVCLVTSGPGATNLVTGLATAYYDSVPLVCFTGQVCKYL